MKKYFVIIPALNESKSLASVIGHIPKEFKRHIIVVDNNSEDNTAQVAETCGAMVAFEPQRGYGASCLRGMAYVRTKLSPADEDVVIFLDGDFSDFPADMTQIIEALAGTDLSLGSRMIWPASRKALLPQARMGNRLACFILGKVFYPIYSDLGPFRAIKWRKLEGLNMQDRGFGWTIEMQVKALQQHYRVIEVPVRYTKRIGHSKITGTIWGSLQASSKILWVLARCLCRSICKPHTSQVAQATRNY